MNGLSVKAALKIETNYTRLFTPRTEPPILEELRATKFRAEGTREIIKLGWG